MTCMIVEEAIMHIKVDGWSYNIVDPAVDDVNPYPSSNRSQLNIHIFPYVEGMKTALASQEANLMVAKRSHLPDGLANFKERQNRKLLEQLEEQKKRLRGIPTHHGSVLPNATSPGAAAVISSVPVPLPPQINPISSTLISETQHMTPAQRAALQHANANSVGFFITQDSSFGNLILPVLPRFEK